MFNQTNGDLSGDQYNANGNNNINKSRHQTGPSILTRLIIRLIESLGVGLFTLFMVDMGIAWYMAWQTPGYVAPSAINTLQTISIFIHYGLQLNDIGLVFGLMNFLGYLATGGGKPSR